MKKEEKNNFTKLTRKGISLIVLIVTIIVVIILAATVILTISNNNPVESAREARFKEDIRSMQDELSMYLSSEYTKNLGDFDPSTVNLTGEDMVKELPSTEGYKDIVEIQSGKLVYKGTNKQERTYFKTVLGDAGLVIVPVPAEWQATIAEVTDDGVPIPKGFTYVTGTKTTGTVIKDTNGNEFVWIPATETSYVKDFTFPSNYGATSSNTSDDTLPSGITDETYDVKKYGGFYIARYEAGIPEGDTTTSNKTGIPVSKKGAVVWTYIDYTNAKSSAESMISNEYVQTGLITGTAWDTTCHFIEDYITTLNSVSTLKNSTYYGNYVNSTFKYINSSNEEVEKTSNSSVKIPTGSTEYTKTKNIYDLAGNVFEWTNEASSSDRIYRGGGYGNYGVYNPVSYRGDGDPSVSNGNIGFRPRLYIK